MDKQNYNPKKATKKEKVYGSSTFEQYADSVGYLGRAELTRRIKNFQGRFKLDFTNQYLGTLSVDRLRHILLAALINDSNDLESRAD